MRGRSRQGDRYRSVKRLVLVHFKPSMMHEREAEARQGLNDLWKAVCEVVAGAAAEADALVLFACDDPVVFYLMPPLVARGAQGARMGRQGAIKSTGRVRRRTDMSRGRSGARSRRQCR
jgi:hypothetical protein